MVARVSFRWHVLMRWLTCWGCFLRLFAQLVRRRVWALFGTPRVANAFFDLYAAAEGQDDWHTALYKASDTGILDAERLEAAIDDVGLISMLRSMSVVG